MMEKFLSGENRADSGMTLVFSVSDDLLTKDDRQKVFDSAFHTASGSSSSIIRLGFFR